MTKRTYGFIALIILVVSFGIFQQVSFPETRECSVNVNYLTKNGGVVMTDCGWFTVAELNPFATYALMDQIQNGKTYEFETTGVIFPYIHSVKEVAS